MKTQTAVEWLIEKTTYDNGYGVRFPSWQECTDLTNFCEQAKQMERDHTTTQIEALRERLRDVPEFFSYTDEIDKVFNEFLKEINE